MIEADGGHLSPSVAARCPQVEGGLMSQQAPYRRIFAGNRRINVAESTLVECLHRRRGAAKAQQNKRRDSQRKTLRGQALMSGGSEELRGLPRVFRP